MLAITNVKIHTVAHGVKSGGVLIDEEGRIRAVGELSSLSDVEVVDGKGYELFPGFIDAHGHAGLFEEGIGDEGHDGNEAVDPITPHLRALDGINPHDEGIKESLAAGVTMMCIVPGSANVIGGEGGVFHLHGNTVEEMLITPKGGMKIAFGENPKRVYGKSSKAPQTRMGIAGLLREHLVKAQNYVKKLQNETPDKPVERDLRLEALAQVIKKEIPLRAHAHRADDIMTAIRIAEEFDLAIVIEHCTEGHKIVQELAKRSIPAVVGPTMTNRSKVELKERTFDTLRILNEAGILLAITLDHPVIPAEQLPVVTALAVKAGLPYEDAIKAITLNPAKILGVDKDYGTIEVGKYADLVLWTKDPLDIQSRVLKVWIHGKLVHENPCC